MSVNLITGYAGTAHITSAGDGAINAGMYTTAKYVFNVGEKFGYEIISNNLIRIKSGYAINQGRKIELAVNDYEEVEIDNGLQGVKRCDLIVLHYEKNLTTGIETATMQVIKGTSGDDYTDPAYTSGNIIDGANEDDFPLYRVKINGLNVEAVEQMFTVTNSIMTSLGRKAPTNHASTATSYGLGTTSKFGHLKISDTYESKVGAATNGIAASQAALYNAFTSLNESLVTESKTRNTEDIKLSASVSEVASSITTVASTANTANATALSAIRARTENIKVTVSNGIATIPFSSISSDVKTSNYVDALIDIFSSNDYIICRKWQSGTNLYVFIRKYDGSVLTSGNLTFQITAFITM